MNCTNDEYKKGQYSTVPDYMGTAKNETTTYISDMCLLYCKSEKIPIFYRKNDAFIEPAFPVALIKRMMGKHEKTVNNAVDKKGF